MALFLYRVTPYRQTNIRAFGYGSIPVTALLIYLTGNFESVSLGFPTGK